MALVCGAASARSGSRDRVSVAKSSFITRGADDAPTMVESAMHVQLVGRDIFN
jgi:hypothetical protein